jgi:hypothetical protein
MIDGISNFDGRTTSHKPGDAKGNRLDATALKAAKECKENGFGGENPTYVGFVAARTALMDFLDAEAIHVPASDNTEQLLIATGIDPHTATAAEVDAAIPEIRQRILGHLGLIQNKDISTGGEAIK